MKILINWNKELVLKNKQQWKPENQQNAKKQQEFKVRNRENQRGPVEP